MLSQSTTARFTVFVLPHACICPCEALESPYKLSLPRNITSASPSFPVFIAPRIDISAGVKPFRRPTSCHCLEILPLLIAQALASPCSHPRVHACAPVKPWNHHIRCHCLEISPLGQPLAAPCSYPRVHVFTPVKPWNHTSCHTLWILRLARPLALSNSYPPRMCHLIHIPACMYPVKPSILQAVTAFKMPPLAQSLSLPCSHPRVHASAPVKPWNHHTSCHCLISPQAQPLPFNPF